MKAKELRAQAREKLAQIPKKRYMVEALIYMAVVVVTGLIGQHFDKDDGQDHQPVDPVPSGILDHDLQVQLASLLQALPAKIGQRRRRSTRLFCWAV